jgi:hypothetical protein
MENNQLMVTSANGKVFTTVKAETKEDKKKLYNALQNCDVMIKDIPGQEITFDGIYVNEYQKTELKEDGTPRIGHKTILFGTDGKTYITTSNYFFNSISQILSANGGVSKDDPITIKIVKKATKGQGEAIAAEWV